MHKFTLAFFSVLLYIVLRTNAPICVTIHTLARFCVNLRLFRVNCRRAQNAEQKTALHFGVGVNNNKYTTYFKWRKRK